MVNTDPILDDPRRELFGKMIGHLSEGYAFIFVGEETEGTIIEYFRDNGIHIEDYIRKGLLTIIKRDVFYSPFIPTKTLLEQWEKLFRTIEKKVGKESFKGFVAMGMPAESFFISDLDNQQLVRYETLAAREYDGSVEAMCIYTTSMLQKLPLRHVISLLNAHQNTGHRNGQVREWNIRRGLSILRTGLDSALGPNVAELVMPILIRDFEMDEEAIITCPDRFEKKLAFLLGTAAAELVIHKMKVEITKDIIY